MPEPCEDKGSKTQLLIRFPQQAPHAAEGTTGRSRQIGASRWQAFGKVIFPILTLLTGCALALARALGECGNVIFSDGQVARERVAKLRAAGPYQCAALVAAAQTTEKWAACSAPPA
jgi:ABC-type sulfate transport system permease subunit